MSLRAKPSPTVPARQAARASRLQSDMLSGLKQKEFVTKLNKAISDLVVQALNKAKY